MAEPLLSRREAIGAASGVSGAALLGITSTVLPSAAAAASDLTQAGVPTSSLVFHLDANQPGGSPATTWQDLSGNVNAAAPGTGVTFVAADGGTPAHYSLDGTETAVIPVAAGATLFGSAEARPGGYTKMVWFRRDRGSGAALDNLISRASTGAPHFLWFREPSYRLLFAGHDDTATAPQATLEVAAGVWTFGAVTFSTVDGLRLFTNTSDRAWGDGGVSEERGFPAYTTAPTDGLSFQVGGYSSSANNRLQGDVATAVVHSRALSVAEVRAYYDATVDRFHA